jgi:DNA invertase Pin-like site-specific DNA recombinase
VVERFEDQGISGAALGNRPGVLRLQDAALARRFDVIVVTDLTRLSRSQGDLSKMIDRLTVKGIRVIGVQDGYDSARRSQASGRTDGHHRRGVSRDGEGSHLCRVRLRQI